MEMFNNKRLCADHDAIGTYIYACSIAVAVCPTG